MENINIFDIVVVSLVLMLGIKGALTGLIKEVFVLVGLIGGVFLASRTASMVGELIDQHILHLENKSSLSLIGFVSILIGVWLISRILAVLFKKMVTDIGFGFLDRFLGFVVGSAKIFFIISIVIYAVSSIEMAKKNLSKYLDNSIMYPIMVEIGSYIIKIDTDDLAQSINSKFSPDKPIVKTPNINLEDVVQKIEDETNLTKKLKKRELE